MKILLAGPGTGKTDKIKSIIRSDYLNANNILVLSFTNATINDLKDSFKDFNNVRCYTLHSYALKINHLPTIHVLDSFFEIPIIQQLAEKLQIDFDAFCGLLQCITFSKMIEKCIDFINANPAYASDNIGQLDLLIVDEFQDFNPFERDLVYLLSKYSDETIILGDDDQSIYDFKDADPDGIIALYNDTNVTKLNHENICYRCPDIIVDCCSNLISRNQHRIDKEWKKSNKDGSVVYEQKLTQEETQSYICEEIKKLLQDSNTILLLSPVSYYISELRDKFDGEGIPYVDFWTAKISADLKEKLWWIKALYGDHKIIFLLLLAKGLKLFNKKSFINILKKAFMSDFDEQKLIGDIINYYPKPFSDYLLEPIPISDFWDKHQDFIKLCEHIDEDNLTESIKNLEKVLNPVLSFAQDSVNIMSIHKSKGLQADYVFIIGLSEGVIPNEIRGIDTIEAQRRLLFVGMTRARKKLYMISTVEWDGKYVHKVDKNQFKYKFLKKKYHSKASRFIEEIKN